MLTKQSILGIGVTVSPLSEILAFIEKYLSSSHRLPAQAGRIVASLPLVIVTPNPEQIMYAQKDEKFREILNSADVALPDGAGVVWALRRSQETRVKGQATDKKHVPGHLPLVPSRIPGIDCMEDLCRLAAGRKWPVAFIGGRGGVAEKALIHLRKKYPGLTGWTQDGPEIRGYEETKGRRDEVLALLSKIQKSGIRLVFVGMGAPKQEFFIDCVTRHVSGVRKNLEASAGSMTHDALTHDASSKPLVLMSVGGSFDVFAGKIRRAPKLVQTMGFEWLWRLILEPWRIVRQIALVRFFIANLFPSC